MDQSQRLLKCPTCGKAETAHGNSFESERAVNIHHKMAHGESLVMCESVCLYCGDTFTHPERVDRVHCSKECQTKSRQEDEWHPNSKSDTYECQECGEIVSTSPFWAERRKYCSDQCRLDNISEIPRPSGEEHPNWNGGESYSYGNDWSTIREKVRERDDYECQICGLSQEKVDQALDVHHLERFASFDSPEEANKIENLITLCKSCHGQVEHGKVSIRG